MRRIALACALLAGAVACAERAPPRIDNTCESDADCYGETTECKSVFGESMCVNAAANAPYNLYILLTGLPSGRGRVDRFALPPMLVDTIESEIDLKVPPGVGVRVLGNVTGKDDRGEVVPLNAEVRFTRVDNVSEMQRLGAYVTQSTSYPTGPSNLVADLEANATYTVRIVPLGALSRFSPPTTRLLDTRNMVPLEVDHQDVQPLPSGILTNEAAKSQAGAEVRLVEQDTKQVLSVTDVVKNDGSFLLRTPAHVLAERKYRLQVNLDEENPWQTTIELDPTRVDAAEGNMIVIPVVPERVLFRGQIESEGNRNLPIAAELTFVSDFEPPMTVGNVRDRDWCSTSVPEDSRPQPRCKTIVRSASDNRGEFSVSLLPGNYTLYVSPGNDPSTSTRAKAAVHPVVVETQPKGAPQQGQVFKVAPSTTYEAWVRNERGEPLAGVVVRAVAQHTHGDIGPVASINRSAEAVTDENGRFELALDTGYYDLVARAGDGFPWVYVVNVRIADATKKISVRGFIIPAPVVLAGTVLTGDTAAKNVAIEAYGEVNSVLGKKLVLLGRATSDAETGQYVLVLPPQILDATMVDKPAQLSR